MTTRLGSNGWSGNMGFVLLNTSFIGLVFLSISQRRALVTIKISGINVMPYLAN